MVVSLILSWCLYLCLYLIICYICTCWFVDLSFICVFVCIFFGLLIFLFFCLTLNRRDVAFYVKYVQNVDPRAFPRQKEYAQREVELQWDFQQGVFVVEAFSRGFMLKCYPDPPFTDNAVRYPSAAVPSNLAAPHEINSEDDVLHVKNLPSFGSSGLGQQDSELLLSMLTVPYLRVGSYRAVWCGDVCGVVMCVLWCCIYGVVLCCAVVAVWF